MPTEVHCLVEDLPGPHAVVRLVGVLDPPGLEPVRGRLLTCLAGRTSAAVVDVSELRVPASAALAVFSAVAREAADWPVGQPLLCTPDPALAALLEDAEIPVTASLPDALTLLNETVPPLRHSTDLPPEVGAARQARETVTGRCGRWGVPELADAASIVVTELVNNVVAHASTGMTLRLACREGALHVAVRDYSAEQPAFGGLIPPRTLAGGRGLLLIDAIARRWGSTGLDDGKVVWAVLHPEDELLG